jgi:LuxR family transcriptional regulator, maltose regulon positive regulatory protein
MLRSELDRLEPDAAEGLAIRASQWCEENGLIDEAVHYGQMADSVERVESILLRHGIRLYMRGRMRMLEGWISWLGDHGSTDGAVAVLGAELLLQLGGAASAERWAKVAEAAPQQAIVPDGSTLEAWVLTLRAIMAVDNGTMQANAERALELLSPRSQFVPMATTMRGVAIMMQGDFDEADRCCADAVELAIESRGVGIASTALASGRRSHSGLGDPAMLRLRSSRRSRSSARLIWRTIR